MVTQVIQKNEKSSEISSAFCLNLKTVQKWVDKTKINKISSTGKGYCYPILAEDNNEKDTSNELNNRDYDMSMNRFIEKALSLAQTRIVNRGYTDCQSKQIK